MNDDVLEFHFSSSDSESSDEIVIKKKASSQDEKKHYNPYLSSYIPNINGKNIFDVDIDGLEEKPWLRPGADIDDYFNYGFDETTCRMYCAKQRILRQENGINVFRVKERTERRAEPTQYRNERRNNRDHRDRINNQEREGPKYNGMIEIIMEEDIKKLSKQFSYLNKHFKFL